MKKIPMTVRKRKQKGLWVSNFAHLMVIFKWHCGSEGVKAAADILTAHLHHQMPVAWALSPLCVGGGAVHVRGCCGKQE